MSTGKGSVGFWRISVSPFSESSRLTRFVCSCTEDGCLRFIRIVGKYLPDDTELYPRIPNSLSTPLTKYEGWNFNSGNYLFTTDTK